MKETSKDLNFLHNLAWALLALASSAVVLVTLFVAYSQVHLSQWGNSMTSTTLESKQFNTVLGNTHLQDNVLLVTGLDTQDQVGHALLSTHQVFDAKNYSYLQCKLDGLQPDLKVYFFWRKAENSEKMFSATIPRNFGEISTLRLDSQSGWEGAITDVAIYVSGDLRGQPMGISEITLLPGNWRLLLAAVWDEWTAFRGWTPMSINSLPGTPDGAEETVSPTIAMALWTALTLVFLYVIGHFWIKGNLVRYGVAILIPWITLDLLWQSQLSTQLQESKHLFSGKTTHEKHLVDLDSSIYTYTKRLKEHVLPSSPSRIFILHDSQGHDFFRLKTQYYLLPHNIYNFNYWLPDQHVQPGDYILTLGAVPGLLVNAVRNQLTWQGTRLNVLVADKDQMGTLYRIPPVVDIPVRADSTSKRLMDDRISHPGLIASLLLPWFMGVVFTCALLRKSARHNWYIVIGQGYFVGIFATTVLMRLSDWTGMGLHFVGLATTVAILGIIGMTIQFAQRAPDTRPVVSRAIPRWQKVVVVTLLGLIAWRYLTLVQELILRPLYAWDAWMNWAPKAIVWFHLEHLVEFVNPEQWLSQGPGLNNYTLGNRQGSQYPPTAPLILLWSMMGAGTWDHSYLFLPWILVAINLGLALYGHLRLNGISVLSSTVACYLLLSIPFLNVHTALAGYADIWLAASLGLAVFALSEWHLNRSWSYAALLLLMTFFCSQLKVPGIVLALILICVFLRSILKLNYKTEMLIAFMLAVAVVLVLWLGVDIEMPHFGHVTLNTGFVSLPALGEFNLESHVIWGRLLESMFLMMNWNILWYWVAALALFATLRGDLFRQPSPEMLVIIGAMTSMFLVLSLILDNGDTAVLATVNRLLLYPIPAIIFYLFRPKQGRRPLVYTSGDSLPTPSQG